ncbi:MAG: hypothetical protein CVT79_08965 [Alphaproteobacteria bacterium HGW-Alphaproteobacteria-18]|nr:MAG: hypothetical protein CVT79_08965 [Alphaproteobacteria bacterium HGW-Alphaproteobacteria-18]
MNKFVLIGVGAGLLVAGGVAAWMISSTPEPEPVLLDPYDYALTESWDTKPAEQPAAVWEDGWAIDVIQLTAGTRRAPEDFATALGVIGPVYAPKLRAPNFAEDAASALQEYLETSNNGRAFVIASNQPLPASAVPVINADAMVRARFGGVLLLEGQETAFAPGVNPASVCSDRFGAGEICAAPVEIKRIDGAWVIHGEGPAGGAVVDGFSEWLDGSAPKLAEPLGDLEEVEIIDIRRPGQTD